MKKLLLLLVLVAGFSYGQNCKIKTDEIDEFTGKRKLETKWYSLSVDNGTSISFRITKIDTDTYLNLIFYTYSLVTIDQNHRMIFKTDKGEFIEVHFDKLTVADGTLGSQWQSWQRIHLSEDDIDNLTQNPLTLVRWESDQGYSDGKIKKSRKSLISEALLCIESKT